MEELDFDIKNYDEKSLIEQVTFFLTDHCYPALWSIMRDPDEMTWQYIEINFVEFMAENQLLGNLVLRYPSKFDQIFEVALKDAQRDIIERLPPDETLVPKFRINIRWHHLPINPECYKVMIPKSSDVNKLISVRGTVVRVSTLKAIEWEIQYQCGSCGGIFTETADIESYRLHSYPSKCKYTNQGKPCTSKKFTKISTANPATLRDYQEVKLQEQVQHLGLGSLPRSLVTILMDDLSGSLNPGDDAIVTGVVKHRWGVLQPGEKPEIELILIGCHIHVTNERKSGSGVTEELKQEFEQFWRQNANQPLLARNAILKSICNEVYGMYIVKLAIAIVLAGGVRLPGENGGPPRRGDSHLLMIGDPGTGKSQILRFAAKMATRSVLTTGIGSTGAGLTATAVRDAGGEWVLEAGALVLADGGACCIDEFSSIQADDQTSIHEAMEQQTLHMAKAGTICTLHTRCAILAATNPKGKYNPEESISVNVALGAPLLSRFDLVLVMADQQDEQWDHTVSSFILHERGLSNDQQNSTNDNNEGEVQKFAFEDGSPQSPISKPNNTMRIPSSPFAESIGGGGGLGGGYPSMRTPNTDAGSDFGDASSVLSNSQTIQNDYSATTLSLLNETWPMEKLQAYISWIKASFKPHITPECHTILKAYYHRQRQSDSKDVARTTARFLESMIRLAQGHAKLMARNVTTVQDAIYAVHLMETSMMTAAMGGKIHSTVRSFFPTNPDLDYFEIEHRILKYLRLEHLASPRPPGSTQLEFSQTQNEAQKEIQRVTGDELYPLPQRLSQQMRQEQMRQEQMRQEQIQITTFNQQNSSSNKQTNHHFGNNIFRNNVFGNDNDDDNDEEEQAELSQHSAWSQIHRHGNNQSNHQNNNNNNSNSNSNNNNNNTNNNNNNNQDSFNSNQISSRFNPISHFAPKSSSLNIQTLQYEQHSPTKNKLFEQTSPLFLEQDASLPRNDFGIWENPNILQSPFASSLAKNGIENEYTDEDFMLE